MNQNHTEIAFILDRSGSMETCREATIAGFNAFLREQKDQPGLARFTLVLFDDRFEKPYASIPIAEVIDLDTASFVPRGSTALLDAICRTIDELGHGFAAQAEPDRPSQVIVAILTDGLENASSQFSWADVASRIKHQTEVYCWTFLFLGANQDAIATAGQMNIASSNAACYVADDIGAMSSHRSTSRKMSALRNKARGTATEEELRVAEAPLNDLVSEDDLQERRNPDSRK